MKEEKNNMKKKRSQSKLKKKKRKEKEKKVQNKKKKKIEAHNQKGKKLMMTKDSEKEEQKEVQRTKELEILIGQVREELLELDLAQSDLLQCILLMKTGSDFLPEQKGIRTGVLGHLYEQLLWQNEKLDQVLEELP